MTNATPDQYHFTGYLTFDEYLESRRAVASRVGLWANAVVLLYGAAMLVWGALLPDGTDRVTAVLLGAAMIFCAVVALPGLFALLVRHDWAGSPWIRKQFSTTVGRDGVTSLDDRGHASHLDWSNFIRFSETKALFLLFLGPRFTVCLPKRLLPESEHGNFRKLVASAMDAV